MYNFIDIFDNQDMIIGLIYGFIIIALILILNNFYQNQRGSKFFILNMAFSVFASLAYAMVYHYYYAGGDTLGYWDGAIKLNNLFWYSPFDYFGEILTASSRDTLNNNFNTLTGYPPIWIYKESESFFVSKFFSIFTFLTFKSYIATSILIGFISGFASWQLFQLVLKLRLLNDWWAALATLFIPSVSFWCNGISKDTLVFIFICYLITYIFHQIRLKKGINFKNIIITLFLAFLVYKVRSYMVYAVALPFLIVFTNKFLIKISRKSSTILFMLRTIFAAFLISLIVSYIQFGGSKNALGAGIVKDITETHQDFKKNKTYKGKRYSIYILNYSIFGIVATAPQSIFAAFYRPLLFEANSIFFLLSGLEGSFFLVITILFIFSYGGFFKNLNYVLSNNFLAFSLYFVLILGFFVGFVSVLFGVLVRFKAPFLPFLAVVLLSCMFKNLPKQKKNIEPQNL